MSRFRVVFLDLDDTIYPTTSGIWQAIGERINRYMQERLGIPAGDVAALRDHYFRTYGTTLNGLVANHHIDPRDYLDYVHDLPLEGRLQPDDRLRSMLESLPQRRVILTNSSRGHVSRVLECLGVGHTIERVIDILDLQLVNKPRPEAYRMAMAIVEETDPHACVAVDDQMANLRTAGTLGMTTVLVGPHSPDGPVDHHIARLADLTRALPELLNGPRPQESITR